jgi:hypothetical protein
LTLPLLLSTAAYVYAEQGAIMRVSKTPEPTVLLIELRSTVFRNCEIDVHTAASLNDAIRLCRICRYDMVLLAAEHEAQEASLISKELWRVLP